MMKCNKLILSLVFVLASLAQTIAQPIFVRSAATGANNGSSWANAYTTLTAALAVAPANSEIWVAAGKYNPANSGDLASSSFELDKPIYLYGGFAGTETALSQRNPATNQTILSGDLNGDDVATDITLNRTDNVYHVINLGTTDGTVFVDGFTVEGGNTPLVTTGITLANRGAGILAQTKCEIRNCTFRANSASGGSAISLLGALASNSVIENCTFSANNSNQQSAGVYMDLLEGAIVKKCTFKDNTTNRGTLYPRNCSALVIDSCVFENNRAAIDNWGAGVYNWQSSMTVLNSTFKGNIARNGSGMYNDGRDGGDFISVQNCLFEANDALNYGGSGMFNATANVEIIGCTFRDNKAPTSAAGIYNGSNTQYNISDCLFIGNNANFAGGAANYTANGTYNNCTFRANTAGTSGAGMSFGFKSLGTVNSCTFTENQARFGAGVFVQNDTTSVSFNDCLFSTNTVEDNGGGLNIFGGANINIVRCEFSTNTANFGGAIAMGEDSLNRPNVIIKRSHFQLNFANAQGGAFNINNGNVVLENSIVGGNINLAGGVGGGFSNNASNGFESLLRLSNCTIANNAAGIGAGVSNWEDSTGVSNAVLSLTNTIFENVGDNYTIEAGMPDVISSGGNHSSDNSFGTAFNGTNDASNLSAQMVDILVDDYSLLPGSPCINTGIAASAPPTDINGGPRDAQPDKGAHEYGSVGVQAPARQFEIALLPNPTTGLLRVQLDMVQTGQLSLRLFDLSGKELKALQTEKSATNQIFEMPIFDVPAGMYTMKAQISGLKSWATVVKM